MTKKARMTKGEKEFLKVCGYSLGGAATAHLIVLGATSPILPIVSLLSLGKGVYHIGGVVRAEIDEQKNRFQVINFNHFIKGEEND